MEEFGRASAWTLAGLLFLVALGCPVSAQADLGPDQNLAMGLFVGSNDGGPDLPRLRYAERDAEKLRDVFVDMAGMAPADAQLLIAPDPD